MSVKVKHVFGRSITIRFTPIADDEDHLAYSLSSARIYSDYPTDTQKANTAGGHIEEIVSWTAVNEEGAGPLEYKIVFSELTDSDPNSNTDYETYYVVINYRMQSGGAIVYTTEQIFVYRPDGLLSKIRCSPEDVYSLESKIEDVAESRQHVQGHIDHAIEFIDLQLDGIGYKKKRTFNRERLNLAARYLAVANCCFDLAGEGNQFWFEKYKVYTERYQRAFDLAKVGYDSAGDDRPDEIASVATGPVYLMR